MINKLKSCVLISTVIGGGIGGYLSYLYNNYIYSGIGGATGYLLGVLIYRLFFITDSYQPKKHKANVLLIFLGIIMSVLGFIAYLITTDKVMMIGCVFFLISTVYLTVTKG